MENKNDKKSISIDMELGINVNNLIYMYDDELISKENKEDKQKISNKLKDI